jgi:hypothetical protein
MEAKTRRSSSALSIRISWIHAAILACGCARFIGIHHQPCGNLCIVGRHVEIVVSQDLGDDVQWTAVVEHVGCACMA